MATLKNKRKLAAVSRETPESTRSGRTQNILDPELTQDYISQVSEVIEGRETQEEIPYCSTSTLSGKQKKARSTSQPQFLSENSPATLEADQTSTIGNSWPLNNWQRTVIQPISTIKSAESRNCRNPSERQCPRLMGNQKYLNCLKIYSKRV